MSFCGKTCSRAGLGFLYALHISLAKTRSPPRRHPAGSKGRWMWALPTCYPYDVARVNMVASYFGAHGQEPFAQGWGSVKANVADVNTLDIMRRGKMHRPKPYHHGNLREALLEAAIRLIAEVGPTAFTLREVARRAGVSHNAPYRHFRDRDDLMAAVAAQGFRELTEAMVDAAGQRSDALDRLKRAAP